MDPRPRSLVMRPRSLLLPFVLACATAAPTRAQAQASPMAINAQLFRPAIGPEDVISVVGTRTPGMLRPMAHLLFEFAYRPLRLVQGDGSLIAAPVETMTTAHVMGGLGLTRWLALSFDLPLVVYQTAGASSPLVPNNPGVFGLGDFRVVVKLRLLNNEKGGFGVALVPQATFPTGNAEEFRGSSLPQSSVYLVDPRLALDYRWQRGAFLALNAGFEARLCGDIGSSFNACDQVGFRDPSTGATATVVSHNVTYGLGAYVPIAGGFGLGGDVIGKASLATDTSGGRYLPLEGYLAARWIHKSGFTATVGGGGSPYLQAAGSPLFRVFAGLGYLPFGEKSKPLSDRDADGIPDKLDACPDDAGAASLDPKRHGCPQDRDGDGVVDERDQCPDQPQGARPDPAKAGCPLTDKDGDGVFDDTDQCVDTPRGDHPDQKRPGCPLTDKDGDGVFDDVDQCVDVTAGPHPDQKRPGCPDTDTDGDAVFDSVDQCPREPAGLNADPARVGCPLPDADRDQVPDAVDACPKKAGAPSPDPKKNGCPTLVEVKNGMIVILREIFFATGKDVIQPKSFPVLQAIADTMQVMTAIKKLGIEGHTDNRGPREKNLLLSERRAAAVKRWLVAHKISEDRLESKGYGPDRPIADNKTLAGQAKNRRVDFRILDPAQAQNAAPAPDSADTVPDQPAAPKATKKGPAPKGAKKGPAPKATKAPVKKGAR